MDPMTIQLIIALLPLAEKLLEVVGPELLALVQAMLQHRDKLAEPAFQARLQEVMANLAQLKGA